MLFVVNGAPPSIGGVFFVLKLFIFINYSKTVIIMGEKFYFTLYYRSFVVNTYIGSRSNAKAYFKRWVRKKHPYYQDYDFIVHRYSSLYDMLNFKNPVGSYELSIVE